MMQPREKGPILDVSGTQLLGKKAESGAMQSNDWKQADSGTVQKVVQRGTVRTSKKHAKNCHDREDFVGGGAKDSADRLLFLG